MKRLAPGYYQEQRRGHQVELKQAGEEVPGWNPQPWYLLVDGRGGDDWFFSKREAMAAIEELLDLVTGVHPSMVAAREAEARYHGKLS